MVSEEVEFVVDEESPFAVLEAEPALSDDVLLLEDELAEEEEEA